MRGRFLISLLSLPGLFAAADTAGATPALRPTYWKEGALIGAGLLGIAVATFGYEFCREGESTDPTACLFAVPLGFVIGALVGAGPGAMIGARFPKHEGTDPLPAAAP